MGDKNLMENILLLEKGVCDLFLHGTIESSTSSVHQAFSTALHDGRERLVPGRTGGTEKN